MNDILPRPSVGSRVDWGAVLAGSVLTIGIAILLSSLTAAAGLSFFGAHSTTTIPMASILWLIVISCIALFVGGMTTSLLTEGETKTEAAIYGMLTWAIVLGFFTVVASWGIPGGISTIVPREMTEERTVVTRTAESGGEAVQNKWNEQAQFRQTLSWYSFGGIWLSMIAATAGSVIGAGPTFRRHVVVMVPHSR